MAKIQDTVLPIHEDMDPAQAPNYFYIYCYRNKLNNKCYIGKTNNISNRRNKHRRLAFTENSQTYFYTALRKYGEDNFEFTILDKFYLEDIIFDLEKFYIKSYKSNYRNFGYNLTAGGEGSSGLRHNDNQKQANKLKVGSNNGNSKLDDNQVFRIYDDYKSGNYVISQLAHKYDVSVPTIERILSGRSWKHLNLNIEALKSIKKYNIVCSDGRIPR